jgi:DNA polymerase III subunit delta
VSAEPLLPAYFLLGSDRPKVRRAVARLRGRFPAESVEHLTADAASGADAVAACNAIGLFGDDGARLVLIEGVERWVAEDVEAVVAYLSAPVETNVLALVAEGAPRTTTLVEAVGSAGKVLRYDAPKPRDLPGWVRAEFERRGAPVDVDTARALVEIVGDDVTELASEIDKIVTWSAGEPIGRREVESLAVSAGDTFVWALTDAWGARDVPGVLSACEAVLESRGKEPFAVASALASSVGRVRGAQAMAEAGLGAAEVAKRLRIKDYPARKALGHAKNFTRDELDSAIVRLAELDAALKGASRLGAELQLERTLLELTETRRPAAASAGR